LDVNGAFGFGSVAGAQVRFEYTSASRALTIVADRPQRAVVDDATPAEIVGTPTRAAVLLLPAGRHTVALEGSNRAAWLLDVASIVSSSLIVAFGSAASLLLVVLYAGMRVRRLIRKRGR
jgi:hypothetical protein